MNQMKTALLLGLLTGLLMLLGGLVGGRQGVYIAFIMAAVMNFASYWWSDKIVLGLYRAQPLAEASSPNLFAMVRELCQRGGLPMPRLYVIEDETPNAFATGRDPEHAVVAVTSGILRILSPRELRGVIAHELSHVKDRDILISSVAATLAGAVMFVANMARWGAFFGGGSRDDEEGGGGMGVVGLVLMSILAPIAAMLIQMAVSRSREYLADHEGGLMSGDPLALAGALNKLEQANHAQPMATAQAQTAHMFIVNPLSGASLANLFSTHPPIPDRIARLQELASQQGSSGYAPSGPVSFSPPPPPPPPPAQPSGQGGRIDWS